MTIRIKDVNFWDLDEPVTVQVKEDDIVVFCNHANAHETTYTNEILNQNGNDIVFENHILECDKCNAYRPLIGDWENAPFAGAI